MTASGPDPVVIVERLGGVVHRQDLITVCGRRSVDAALAADRLVMPRRSWIRLPEQIEDVCNARAVRGTVAGMSAALHHNWQVKRPPARTEIVVPGNRGRLRPDLDLRRRDLPPGATMNGVLTPAATVVDCARAHPFDAALSVADSALRSGRVTRQEITTAALALSPRQRRRVARVLDAANPLAANPFESVARAIALEVPGLRVVPQGDVDGIGHGDLVDHRLRIVIECESHEFHALPEAFRYDVRRYTRMVVADWIVVRVVWEDVMHKPAQVRRTFEAAVELAHRRGATSLAGG
jgi:very-short-patch-repair endonuclease